MTRLVELIFDGPESAHLAEREIPARLGPREVLIETAITAVSPGTERANYLGEDPDAFSSGAWCAYPWRAGYSGVGRVVAIGSHVEEYSEGDRVVGMLWHASHCVMSCDDEVRPFGPLAAEVSEDAAALIRLFGIAATPAELIGIPSISTRVGVWGMGVIGNMAAQILKAVGYAVLAVDPDAPRRAIASDCGLRHVGPDIEAALAAAGWSEVDVAVDAVGLAANTVRIGEYVSAGGLLVLMTHWRSQPRVDAEPLVSAVFKKGLVVKGALEYATRTASPNWATRQRKKWAWIAERIASGDLRSREVVGEVISPDDLPAFYERLVGGGSKGLTTLVDWSSCLPAAANEEF